LKSAIGEQVSAYWSRWAKQRALAENPQRFHSGNLYILPSLFGWLFALVLFTLFLCAVNYQVSSVFFLTFLLAVGGMVSAWEAHFNLKGIAVNCLSIDDVHQHGLVKVVLAIQPEKKMAYALKCHFIKQEVGTLDVIPSEGTRITLMLPAADRGCFPLPRITFYSYFPLGLFRVWGYIYFDTQYYVYPMSVSSGSWPTPASETGGHFLNREGNEEIYDLKPALNPWTQASRIAWKIAARGQGWYLKTMISPEGNHWIFRIQDSPSKLLEENLQHLCFWLEEAERKGYVYGLELKGTRTNLANGPAHLSQCLRQLATY